MDGGRRAEDGGRKVEGGDQQYEYEYEHEYEHEYESSRTKLTAFACFHPPSISEFQPLIVRPRAGHFLALPTRPGQLGTRAEDRGWDETISGRIHLPVSHSSTSLSEFRYTSNGPQWPRRRSLVLPRAP